MQGHTFDYITNHNATPPPSYSSTPPHYAVEQSPGYLQENGDVSKFGDPGNSFAGPATGLGFEPSPHNCASGQVIGADPPWSQISSLFLPLLQDPPPSDDFNIGDTPLLPEETQAEIEQMRPWAPSPYTYPTPSSSSCTSDGWISSYPSYLMPEQTLSSRSPQERLGYSLSINSHSTRPADLPGFHGLDARSKVELHTSGTLNDYSVQTLGDHPSHILFNHAPYIRGNNTAGGGVDDYGNVDDSKFNTEQVVPLLPQLLLPPNRLTLPRKFHSRTRMSRTEGGSLSANSHHTRHFATGQSKFPTGLAKARSACDLPASHFCGWRDDKGRKCGMPISYDNCAGHFAAFHQIRGMAWNVKVVCCWCPSEPRKEVIRKNLLRHLREAHLYYPRSEKGT
ncbi:hypothetical protein EDD16DRAFT_224939 [Pisolithus croceorrhizus]|nr:hypothetical protein EDD16DRAFT_224939 [Pisolithus croceorrhizus]